MNEKLECSEIKNLFTKVMSPMTFDSIPPETRKIIQQGKMEMLDTVETVLKGE